MLVYFGSAGVVRERQGPRPVHNGSREDLIMVKLIGVAAGLAVVAALMLSGVAAPSASAAIFECYKVSKFEAKRLAGNYSKANCEKASEVEALTGEYVLAEILNFVKETLYCALLPTRGTTAAFQNATCPTVNGSTELNQGEFVEVALQIPNILPEGAATEPIKSVNKSGRTTFGSGVLELESPSSSGTQEGFALKLGSFVVTFKEVVSINLGVKCTGLTRSTAGEVEVLGTYHIRDYKNSTGESKIASIFLLLPVHFTCLTTLVVVSGCVAGAATPESTLTKTIAVTLNKVGTDDEIITVLNEENAANELCQLLAKEGSNATKLSVQKQVSELTGFEQGGKAVEVLLMPL
jgi:hypothetical protein